MSFSILITALKGSSSSGNYGHAGRLGKKGGSAPKSGIGAALSLRTGANAAQRQAVKTAITAPKPSEPYVQSDKEAKQLEDYKAGLGPTDAYGLIDDVDSWSSTTRGNVKNEIVTNLSNATGLSYDAVNDAIHQWAQSSNDTDYRSLSMQESAARVFGTQLSEFQKEKIVKVKNGGDEYSASPEHAFEAANKPYATPAAATDAFLRTMHAQTQEHFKQQGITSVTLYRGTRGSLNGAKQGDTVGVASNAMESWTIEPLVAKEFGYNVLKAEVPVSRIISTARTGFGCLDEYEFVVIGGKAGDTALVESTD